MAALPLHHQIATAARAVVDSHERGMLREAPDIFGGEGMPFGRRRIERAGGDEKTVADLFGGEPAGDRAPEKLVVGIALDRVSPPRSRARALVGGRIHDEAVKGLEAPTIGLEASREPFEELWVGRRLAARAEVVWRPHDPGAEMPLPETVDDHARGERALGDPAGQLPPAAPTVGRHRLTAEDAEPAPRHRGARLLRIAPLVEGSIVGLPLDDGVGHRERRLRRQLRERLGLELPKGDKRPTIVSPADDGERERNAVERGRMAVGHRAADEISAVGRADPGDGDRTILRGVDEEGVAGEIGPGLDRTRGRVGKRAR